jgi:hypothetical protein
LFKIIPQLLLNGPGSLQLCDGIVEVSSGFGQLPFHALHRVLAGFKFANL